MRAVLAFVTILAMTGPALADKGIEMFDPATGTSVTIPEDWEFAGEGDRLLAWSPGRSAMIFLVEAGDDFEDEAMRIDQVVNEHLLSNVVIDRANILLAADRGALAGAVAAEGRGISRLDGLTVSFFSLLVKGAEGDGGLLVGAWKDVAFEPMVRNIVNSVQVRQPEMEAGLELRDKRTGAAVKLPSNWSVFSARHGLVTVEPDGNAMAILMAPEKNHREIVATIRYILREAVFTDIRIGDFVAVTGTGIRGTGEIVQATGTAKKRSDGADVEFMALVAEHVEKNRGVLIVGAWTEPAYKTQVERMLKTLELPRMVGSQPTEGN
jgi:hypothetical protein